ncbi:MAG: Gfo/Idh/MocA family protein, partial [Thermoprotei archaeon]
RYNPELIAAKKFVDTGFLGKPYFAEAVDGGRRRGIPGWGSGAGPTFISKAMASGGATLDIGVYALDNALYLLDHPRPISVDAATWGYLGKDEAASKVVGTWAWDANKFEVEDFATAFIRFEGGLVMLFKESWAMHAETLGNPLLLGTKGGVTIKDGVPILYSDMNGYMVNVTPQGLPKIDTFTQKIVAFVDAIKNNKASPIDPRGIVIMHYIIDALYQSSGQGAEVAVKLPQDL